MARDTQFSLYEITNGHILFEGGSKSDALGCTGDLEVSSEVKTVVKKCEGVVKDSKAKIVGQKLKFVGHVEKEVLRKIFGIDKTGLKAGVYAYGTDSFGKPVTLTWDAYDLYQTDKLLLAFPKCTPAGGYSFKVKNAEDEVAEIEIEFDVMADENGNFMYEAFESEATDVKAKWHEKFEPSKVKNG